MNIFSEAAKLEAQNRPFALAQIVDSRGFNTAPFGADVNS